MFRSSKEDCQGEKGWWVNDPNKVEVGDIQRCYIEDCSTGEFVWEWDIEEYVRREKQKALWMIIPAAIILSCCVCFPIIPCLLAILDK